MADPVVDPEGNSYDRRSIEAWLRQHGSSPITRSPLTADRLAPNRALKDAIEAWRAQHPNAVARVAPKPAQGTIAVSVTSYAVAGNEAHSDVVVTLDAGAGRGRVPVDLVCVIDISGSMQDEAKAHNDKGDVESHGLSLLDITKHAVSTIIHSLGPLDRLALVSYSDRAREELPLTTMDSTGQNTADTKLKVRIVPCLAPTYFLLTGPSELAHRGLHQPVGWLAQGHGHAARKAAQWARPRGVLADRRPAQH